MKLKNEYEKLIAKGQEMDENIQKFIIPNLSNFHSLLDQT